MEKHALTFQKLGIDPTEWDVIYADTQSGYTFITPIEGVLLLRSAGVLTPDILEKQLQFINNYVIQVQSKILNFKTILILDVADLYNISSLDLIRKNLKRINTGLIFLIPGSLFKKLYVKYYRLKQHKELHATFEHYADAVEFARNIKKKSAQDPFSTGKFIECWSHDQQKTKINGVKYKFLELPAWQYRNETQKLSAIVRCYDSGILHFSIHGRMNALDIQTLQQRVFDIGNTLGIDFVKNPFSIVFDLRNVQSITPDGRKLLRHMEEHQQKIAETVIVLGNRFIRFLLQIRKSHQPVKYSHWHTASNLDKAFKKIENIKFEKTKNKETEVLQEEPAEDYKTLKSQYLKTLAELKRQKNKEKQTNKNIRKILAYIHTGDFLRLPFHPRYSDYSIEGEIYNSIALLHKDLQNANLQNGNTKTHNLTLSRSNVEKIVDSISDPTMIYQDNKILAANHHFVDLLGYQSHELNGQPIGAIINPFEVNRIVRQLDEIHTRNEIYCDLQDAMGIAHSVTMISELVMIDGLQAQFVFIKPLATHTKTPATQHNQPVMSVQNSQFNSEYINKALAGIIAFHHAMLKHINNQVLNEYNAPDKHDSYQGLQSLLWVSFFLKNAFDQAATIDFSENKNRMISPGDLMKNLFTLFSDYLALSKEHIRLDVREDHSMQKLALPLDAFLIKAILVRLLHLVADNAKGNHLLFGYRQRSDEKIEFFIHENGPALNLVETDVQKGQTLTGFSFAEIDQLMKKADSNLYLETSDTEKNQITLVFPIYERGTGYEGSMMDLANHKILILGPENEFELISKLLEDTEINLIPTNNIFESQKLLKREKISLMMIDIQNKKTDISELIKKAKEIAPDIPIIFIVESESTMQSRYSKLKDLETYLTKPIDGERLKSTIKKALS